GDSRLPCPSKNLHLRLVIAPIRMRTVHDIDDGASIKDRLQELALLLEPLPPLEVLDERLHNLPPRRRRLLTLLQKPQRPGGVLKPRRIHHLEQSLPVHPKRKPMNLPRRSRLRRNYHRIVFRQGRKNTRFAAIHPP